MIRFSLVLWHISHGRLFNAESSLNLYIKYLIYKNIFLTFLSEPELIFSIKMFQAFLSNTNNPVFYNLRTVTLLQVLLFNTNYSI